MKNAILENFKNIVSSVCKNIFNNEQIKTKFLFKILSSKKCCSI